MTAIRVYYSDPAELQAVVGKLKPWIASIKTIVTTENGLERKRAHVMLDILEQDELPFDYSDDTEGTN